MPEEFEIRFANAVPIPWRNKEDAADPPCSPGYLMAVVAYILAVYTTAKNREVWVKNLVKCARGTFPEKFPTDQNARTSIASIRGYSHMLNRVRYGVVRVTERGVRTVAKRVCTPEEYKERNGEDALATLMKQVRRFLEEPPAEKSSQRPADSALAKGKTPADIFFRNTPPPASVTGATEGKNSPESIGFKVNTMRRDELVRLITPIENKIQAIKTRLHRGALEPGTLEADLEAFENQKKALVEQLRKVLGLK